MDTKYPYECTHNPTGLWCFHACKIQHLEFRSTGLFMFPCARRKYKIWSASTYTKKIQQAEFRLTGLSCVHVYDKSTSHRGAFPRVRRQYNTPSFDRRVSGVFMYTKKIRDIECFHVTRKAQTSSFDRRLSCVSMYMKY
ncbi:unnamed protein product [Ectocarpus sp. 4 AP-2014]